MIIETKNIPPNLTGGVLRLLCAISDKPGSTCTELAESLNQTTANVTGLLDAAEVCQLACRTPFKDDRRKWSVQLTDIGTAIVEKLKPREGKV